MSRLKQRIRCWIHARAMLIHQPRRLPLSHWDLEDRPQGLFLHGVALAELMQAHGSPLHVLNVPRLLGNLDAFRKGGAGIAPTICCSVKSYPVPGQLAILRDAGAEFEVISEHELWMVRRLGVPAGRIIFNGPAKSDNALVWAITNGVKAVHLNHREEMARVSAIAAQVGRTARVGFRLATPGVQGQFGFSTSDPGTLGTVKCAMDDPWLDLISLHSHRGEHMRTAGQVRDHVNHMLRFAALLTHELGWTCRLLDVGGSLAARSVAPLSGRAARMAWTFGVPAHAPDPEQTLSPAEYTTLVCTLVADAYASRGVANPEVVMEPGRALASDAQTLLSTVMELRHATPFSYAVTDVGAAVAPSACQDYHQIALVRGAAPPGSAAEKVYRLVGPICHLGDVASPAWQLPQLARGDIIAMMDAGVYFISNGSSFSFTQPGVVAVHADGRTELLRRTETSEDIVQRDRFA